MRWQIIQVWTDDKAGNRTSTAAMQLPHGCLMRVVVEAKNLRGNYKPVSVAVTFVPGAAVTSDGKIERKL